MKVFEIFKEEDHRRALYVSMIFIMLMILFFLLVSLEEPNPPIEEEIIEIQMPDIEVEEGGESGGGSDNSEEVENVSSSQVVEEPAREVETQTEETVQVTSSNGNSNNNTTQVSEPEPNSDFTFSGSGSGTGAGNGTQFGNGSGVGQGQGGGRGNGSYNPDRKVMRPPSFDANAQEEGSVALDIWVDANGNVVRTRFKESKSTTGSQYLIGLAIKAAKTMKYDKKSGVRSEHVGYKVFVFRKS